MAGEFLRTETFEAWASNFDRRLDDAIALRQELNETQQTVAVLKDRSESAHRFSVGSLVASALTVVANVVLKLTGH